MNDRRKSTCLPPLLCLLVAVAFWSGDARAQTPDDAARDVFKKMTDYVSSLDAIGIDYSVALEAVTTEGIKLQFPASGQILLDRPNKFRVTRTGGHSDIELVSDGETVTLYGKKANAYAQNAAPESIDAFVNKAREERGVELPGADLLLSNVYEELTEPVTEAMYLGNGVIDGVECEHLAFRTPEVDWQIWVATGDKPYPCQYVVTSKWTTGAPEYQLRIRKWDDSPEVSDQSFKFEPSDGAKKTELSEINAEILLPEAVKGAKK